MLVGRLLSCENGIPEEVIHIVGFVKKVCQLENLFFCVKNFENVFFSEGTLVAYDGAARVYLLMNQKFIILLDAKDHRFNKLFLFIAYNLPLIFLCINFSTDDCPLPFHVVKFTNII